MQSDARDMSVLCVVTLIGDRTGSRSGFGSSPGQVGNCCVCSDQICCQSSIAWTQALLNTDHSAQGFNSASARRLKSFASDHIQQLVTNSWVTTAAQHVQTSCKFCKITVLLCSSHGFVLGLLSTGTITGNSGIFRFYCRHISGRFW